MIHRYACSVLDSGAVAVEDVAVVAVAVVCHRCQQDNQHSVFAGLFSQGGTQIFIHRHKVSFVFL